jgi:osmoprotectant transport system substrate-binding protein/osmoprotectant transport system permease protein
MSRWRIARIAIAALAFLAAGSVRAEEARAVRVGTKEFTESVILGNMLDLLARDAGAGTMFRPGLGGTRVLWDALRTDQIDIYPEYTGTLIQEILSSEHLAGDSELRAALAKYGLVMSRPLGFNNTYGIGMKKEVASKLDIKTISDLAKHPELRFGFSNEFMSRGDGWPSLRDAYHLPQTTVNGREHDLAYRGLASGGIDAIDVYTTDAEIADYDLAVLDDDLHHFPVYDAVWLYRADLAMRAPAAVAAFKRLEGAIDAKAMTRLNARVKIGRETEKAVAADFLRRRLGVDVEITEESWWHRFVRHSLEHLTLVGISLGAAILLAVPLGIAAFCLPRAAQVILAVVGLIQTIPSLALFVFMIPLLGIGGPPAVVALFLYSLLPIVRNTYTGLLDIAGDIRESAAALGLPLFARLRLVELPIAGRSILSGIKTSAVINVGTATLGALIGAGGYGQPILTGIRLNDTGLILEGAVPAAALALIVQGLFEIAERLIVPAGLRLKPQA